MNVMLAGFSRRFLSLNLVSCRKMSIFPQVKISPEPSMFDEPVEISIQGERYELCMNVGVKDDPAVIPY